MRRLALATLVALSLTDPIGAQQPGPEAAAQQYADAIQRGDYAAAARLTHPAALRQLRELFEPLLESEMFDQIGPLFSLRSPADLKTTADTTLFAALIKNVFTQQAGFGEALRTAKTTILGHVVGGADTTFVITRTELSIEGVKISQFDVMPFARLEGQWRALLKADISNMAAMMRRALARP